jgi:methylmalonyl-CoA mutase
MPKAIAQGYPKLRIEESAARTQARIDSKQQIIVGVNRYKLTEEPHIDTLSVNNTKVRDAQLARLSHIRATRNEEDTQHSLRALEEAARTGTGNLLDLSIQAARKRATVGEISLALEKVFGRHKASTQGISGVYQAELGTQKYRIEEIRNRVLQFVELDGRRPRILIAKMGQDGHDRGQKVIAAAFADMGFDVDIGPLFQTPQETALQAVENDVHVVGVSSLAAGHLTLVPALRAALAQEGRPEILVVVGGVIPPSDYEALYKAGAAAIFGPGTVISDAAHNLLDKLEKEFA